jgi:hypothetical protein
MKQSILSLLEIAKKISVCRYYQSNYAFNSFKETTSYQLFGKLKTLFSRKTYENCKIIAKNI